MMSRRHGLIGCSLASFALTVSPAVQTWWNGIQQASGPISHYLTLGCLGIAGVVAVPVGRHRPAMFGAWALGFLVMGLGLQCWIDLEAERLHVVQYGLISVAAWWATPHQWPWLRRASAAIGWALGLGVVDELLQWWLPYRVGDWRDVLLDGLGGLMGCYVLLPWRNIQFRQQPEAWAILVKSRHPQGGLPQICRAARMGPSVPYELKPS